MAGSISEGVKLFIVAVAGSTRRSGDKHRMTTVSDVWCSFIFSQSKNGCFSKGRAFLLSFSIYFAPVCLRKEKKVPGVKIVENVIFYWKIYDYYYRCL